MRVLEIKGDTPVEYTNSMLAVRNEVADAGYHPTADQMSDDVWDFGLGDDGLPDIRVIWGTAPKLTGDSAEEVAQLLVQSLAEILR